MTLKHNIFLVLATIAAATQAEATVTVNSSGSGIRLYSSSTAYASNYVSGGTPDYVNSSSTNQTYPALTSIPSAPLTLSSLANAVGLDASAHADNTSSATFFSANSGTVSFTGDTSASIVKKYGRGSAYSNYWFTYDFHTDSDATILINYNLSGPNIYSGDNQIDVIDDNGSVYVLQHFMSSGDLSGALQVSLSAGHSYILQIANEEIGGYDAPFFTDGQIGTQSFSHDDQYSFSISSSVPEPECWMMMIVGFGILGGMTRTKRRSSLAI